MLSCLSFSSWSGQPSQAALRSGLIQKMEKRGLGRSVPKERKNPKKGQKFVEMKQKMC